MYRFAVQRMGASGARRAVWLVALFPFSFFFSAPYPQSLFFALAVWSVTLAVEGRWLVAATIASFAGVTFPHGLLLPLVLGVLRSRATARVRPRELSTVAVVGVASLAPALLMAYFLRRYGDALVFTHAYFAVWGGTLGLQHWKDAIAFVVGDPPLSVGLPLLWNLMLVPAVALAAYKVWRKYGSALGIFCVVPVLFALLVTVAGLGRLVAATFPVFLWLGWRVRDRMTFGVLCGVFGSTLAYFAYSFCHGSPVGGP